MLIGFLEGCSSLLQSKNVVSSEVDMDSERASASSVGGKYNIKGNLWRHIIFMEHKFHGLSKGYTILPEVCRATAFILHLTVICDPLREYPAKLISC